MEVILLERVEKLGAIGDVVKVKDGFARNYLLPQQEGAPRQRSQPQGLRSQSREDRGRQCRPPDGRRKGVEGRRRQERPADPPGVQHRPALRLGQRPRHRRGARGRRRSRSTKSQVVLDRPIKAIGVHEVKIALHPEVAVTVKVNVARSPEEADLQAQGVDVMAQMFERDTAAFTEEFDPNAEPGEIAAAPAEEAPAEAAQAEAEVGTGEE